MSALLAFALAAVTWYPAADWRDTPDPVASPHAKKGGTKKKKINWGFVKGCMNIDWINHSN